MNLQPLDPARILFSSLGRHGRPWTADRFIYDALFTDPSTPKHRA